MNYQFEMSTDLKLILKQDTVIRDGLMNFNEPFFGRQPERFSIYVKNDDDDIIGGAIVHARTKSIYVDVLWVNENYQGLGLGTQLLNKVEKEALDRNITESTLDTYSFQAETFYIKQGYKHLGTIENYIEGHDRIYMRKTLK